MIHDLNLQEVPSVHEFLCDAVVEIARLWITGGVIVCHGDRCGIFDDRGSEDLCDAN